MAGAAYHDHACGISCNLDHHLQVTAIPCGVFPRSPFPLFLNLSLSWPSLVFKYDIHCTVHSTCICVLIIMWTVTQGNLKVLQILLHFIENPKYTSLDNMTLLEELVEQLHICQVLPSQTQMPKYNHFPDWHSPGRSPCQQSCHSFSTVSCTTMVAPFWHWRFHPQALRHLHAMILPKA